MKKVILTLLLLWPLLIDAAVFHDAPDSCAGWDTLGGAFGTISERDWYYAVEQGINDPVNDGRVYIDGVDTIIYNCLGTVIDTVLEPHYSWKTPVWLTPEEYDLLLALLHNQYCRSVYANPKNKSYIGLPVDSLLDFDTLLDR